MKLNKRAGFTLIEILVAIAIIALLSVIVFASFEDARKKARDAARHSDIQQLSAALQVYATANGEYPTDLNQLVTAGLFTTIPTDPVNSGSQTYVYQNTCNSPAVSNNDQYYRLYTIGEREQYATDAGWTDSMTIGATSCADPQ